jgi:hypothetical protein
MKDMTLINVILDRSGSMFPIAEEVVGMYNRFLEEQQNGPDYAELSLIQFDDRYEVSYLRKPIDQCPPLVNGETYKPLSMTALLDAVGFTIDKIGADLATLPEAERPRRVLFVIITDGEENCSSKYKYPQIKEMIEHQQEKYSWDFIFLAAGIDAFAEGSKFGMAAHKCGSVDHSGRGMAVTCDAISSYTTAYRTTGDTDQSVGDHL